MSTGRTDYLHRYEADSAFTSDYNGSYYHEPWVSYTIENKEVHYNKRKTMTVSELFENGYAEITQDRSEIYTPGSETNYEVIQIHPNCPVRLENITDFDDYLTSATTFVWREDLPDKWSPEALAAKYDNVELSRPPMIELFSHIDLSGVDELTLSFAPTSWYVVQSSLISQRWIDSAHNTATFKTPKHLTVKFRGNYSSVAQTMFSKLMTTTSVTMDVAEGYFLDIHDTTGMFEGNTGLKTIEVNGLLWSGLRTCHLMFDGCSSLTAVPYSSNWSREHNFNTIYPRRDEYRGTARCGGLFNAAALEYIGPVINMNAISLCGCTADGRSQDPLPYMGKGLFNCPKLTDVRIINLNNNDWNFAAAPDTPGYTYTYAPKMDVDSIEYLLNHVYDCSADPHTVTFSDLHENEVSSATIQAVNAKGWTVTWQPAD